MTSLEARIKIWARPGEPLREKDWKANGFATLADYVKSLDQESRKGHRKNGRDEGSSDHLPLVSFGVFDPMNEKKEVVVLCKTYEDLPVGNITYAESNEGRIYECPILIFENA